MDHIYNIKAVRIKIQICLIHGRILKIHLRKIDGNNINNAEADGDTNYNWYTWNNPQGIGTGTGNKRTSGDYPKLFMLCFDLRPGPKKCYSKVMHRKEVTHSNGQ